MSSRAPIALLGLALLPGIPVFPATLGVRYMTTSRPPDRCADARVNPPQPPYQFLVTDARAYLFFEAYDLARGDILTISYVSPTGSVQYHGSWSPITEPGYGCFLSSGFLIAGAAPATITGRWEARVMLNGQPFFSVEFFITGVVVRVTNDATRAPGPVAPGSVILIEGRAFAPQLQGCDGNPDPLVLQSAALPLSRRSLSVHIGDRQVPLFAVCNQAGVESITAQVPFETSPGLQQLRVVIGSVATPVYQLSVQSVSPGLYCSSVRRGATSVSASNPARQGDTLTVSATGLGPVTTAVSTGVPCLVGQSVSSPITVGLSGAGVPLLRAECSAARVGVYEVDFRVPADNPLGNQPLVLAAGSPGVFSNSCFVPIDRSTVAPLTITTASPLPEATVGTPYRISLGATGGTGPYTWSWTGQTPPGLTLASLTGEITGTPTQAGNWTFTVTVRDNAQRTASKGFVLAVTENPEITSESPLPDGAVGVTYRIALGAIKGAPPYAWSWSGVTPPGLSLSPTTGEITGTPSAAATYTFTVRVVDAASKAATKSLELRVLPRLPTVTVSGLPSQAASAQQLGFRVRLASAYPVQVSGEIALSFSSNAVNQADDPAMVFLSGGRRATFTVPAGSTESAEIRFQTGTVAGTINFAVPTIRANARGGDIGMTSISNVGSTSVPRAAPVVRTACFASRSSSALSIQIVGYSNTRDLTQAVFSFTAEPGFVVQPASYTQLLSSTSGDWFRGAGVAYGGQFTYTQSFTVSKGDLTKLSSVSVTLSNSAGSSSPVTVSGACP